MTIQGPIRIVAVANIPGQYLAVDRLGRYLAQGFRGPLEEMASAFNASLAEEQMRGNEPSVDPVAIVQVTACPSCGYPKESEDQDKCLSCLNPPLPTVEEEVKQKQVEQEQWF